MGSASRGGRPRDPELDAAIGRATVDLLVETGYNALRMDAVARRAGVGRPALYRRWPTKAELVHGVVFPDRPVRPLADTGDFERDVAAVVADVVRYFARPEALAALPGVLAEYQVDPGLHDRMLGSLETAMRGQWRALVASACARGQAHADADPDMLFDMLTGTVIYALLVSRTADRPGFAASLAAAVSAHGSRPPDVDNGRG